MGGAKANRTRVAFIEEVTWGVMPPTPVMQKINWTAESLDYNLETTTPDTVRDDRMISDVMLLSGGNEGGFEFEWQALQSGPDDPFLVGALWAQAWIGVNAGAASMDSSAATIVKTSRTWDFTGSAAPGTLVVGQKFKLIGSVLGNDGVYTVESITSPGIYITTETPASDETLTASTINGQMIRNGVIRHSYYFERGHLDIDEFFQFWGMTINELTLTFEGGAKVTGAYTFVGKDSDVLQAEVGSEYTDQPITDFMTASFNVRNVFLDDLPIETCILMGMELTINNNVVGKPSVGNFGFCDVSEGEASIGGSISLYFNDSTFYQAFKGNTAMSLAFELYDSDGNSYVVTIPRFKLSDDTVNATGKNTDVMDEGEFAALIDPDTVCELQIDRFIPA